MRREALLNTTSFTTLKLKLIIEPNQKQNRKPNNIELLTHKTEVEKPSQGNYTKSDYYKITRDLFSANHLTNVKCSK